MRAGRLNRQVTIQSLSVAQDTTGQAVRSYSTLATVWAAIDPMSGREYGGADRTTNDATHKVVIRYLAGVAVTGRVVYGARTFGIVEVRNLQERNRELVLLCREMVTGEPV